MSRRHPSRKRLERWFDGEPDEAGLDEHLDECERCAAVIEELAVGDDPVPSALRRVLMPPDDLRERIEVGINRRLQNRQDLALVVDLLGIGVGTARLMLDAATDTDTASEENES